MSENQAPYSVSYIASAPEELKVGDRVEVIGASDNLYRKQGFVQTVPVDGRVMVEFANNVSYSVRIEKLRKLPDTPEELKVGDRVTITKEWLYHYGNNGVVTDIRDNTAYVKFENEKDVCRYKIIDLCKLPDTISFEDNPLDKQVGGSHYKKCKIEPAEYIHANGLDFFQGNVVKYITRFRDKDGKKDLEKIKHYCDMLIQLEYPDPDFENVV